MDGILLKKVKNLSKKYDFKYTIHPNMILLDFNDTNDFHTVSSIFYNDKKIVIDVNIYAYCIRVYTIAEYAEYKKKCTDITKLARIFNLCRHYGFNSERAKNIQYIFASKNGMLETFNNIYA